MSRTYLKEEIAISPSTFQLDFTQIPNIQDSNGPHWLSVNAWVHSPDFGLGGGDAFVANVSWLDPAGELQVTDNTVLLLNSATPGKLPTKVMQVDRQSGSSLWLFDMSLFGSAGSALVSYRIMFSSADLTCDFNSWL